MKHKTIFPTIPKDDELIGNFFYNLYKGDILKNSIVYKFENNVYHFGQLGLNFIKKIREDNDYRELIELGLFLVGEDCLFEKFLKKIPSIFSLSFNYLTDSNHLILPISDKILKSSQVEIMGTINLNQTIKEVKTCIDLSFRDKLEVFKENKKILNENAYVRVEIDSLEKIDIIKDMFVYAIETKIHQRDFELENEESFYTDIAFYEKMIQQLNYIKESKEMNFLYHSCFYDLINYSLGLRKDIFKGDLEFKKLMPSLLSNQATRYQEYTDEEYIKHSDIAENMRIRMLEIRENFREEIDFYIKLIYVNGMYENPDFRAEIISKHPIFINDLEYINMRNKIKKIKPITI